MGMRWSWPMLYAAAGIKCDFPGESLTIAIKNWQVVW